MARRQQNTAAAARARARRRELALEFVRFLETREGLRDEWDSFLRKREREGDDGAAPAWTGGPALAGTATQLGPGLIGAAGLSALAASRAALGLPEPVGAAPAFAHVGARPLVLARGGLPGGAALGAPVTLMGAGNPGSSNDRAFAAARGWPAHALPAPFAPPTGLSGPFPTPTAPGAFARGAGGELRGPVPHGYLDAASLPWSSSASLPGASLPASFGASFAPGGSAATFDSRDSSSTLGGLGASSSHGAPSDRTSWSALRPHTPLDRGAFAADPALHPAFAAALRAASYHSAPGPASAAPAWPPAYLPSNDARAAAAVSAALLATGAPFPGGASGVPFVGSAGMGASGPTYSGAFSGALSGGPATSGALFGRDVASGPHFTTAGVSGVSRPVLDGFGSSFGGYPAWAMAGFMPTAPGAHGLAPPHSGGVGSNSEGTVPPTWTGSGMTARASPGPSTWPADPRLFPADPRAFPAYGAYSAASASAGFAGMGSSNTGMTAGPPLAAATSAAMTTRGLAPPGHVATASSPFTYGPDPSLAFAREHPSRLFHAPHEGDAATHAHSGHGVGGEGGGGGATPNGRVTSGATARVGDAAALAPPHLSSASAPASASSTAPSVASATFSPTPTIVSHATTLVEAADHFAAAAALLAAASTVSASSASSTTTSNDASFASPRRAGTSGSVGASSTIDEPRPTARTSPAARPGLTSPLPPHRQSLVPEHPPTPSGISSSLLSAAATFASAASDAPFHPTGRSAPIGVSIANVDVHPASSKRPRVDAGDSPTEHDTAASASLSTPVAAANAASISRHSAVAAVTAAATTPVPLVTGAGGPADTPLLSHGHLLSLPRP